MQPGSVDAERTNRQLVGTGADRDLLEALADAAEEPAVDGPDPEDAPAVARERLDLQPRQPGLRTECLEPAPRHPEEAATVRSDPERPVEVGEEREDGADGELGVRPVVEQGELGPVESDEPFLGPDPEVSLGRLGDRLDRVLGEALAGLPRVERRLREGSRRVRRPGPGRGGEERERQGRNGGAKSGRRPRPSRRAS